MVSNEEEEATQKSMGIYEQGLRKILNRVLNEKVEDFKRLIDKRLDERFGDSIPGAESSDSESEAKYPDIKIIMEQIELIKKDAAAGSTGSQYAKQEIARLKPRITSLENQLKGVGVLEGNSQPQVPLLRRVLAGVKNTYLKARSLINKG